MNCPRYGGGELKPVLGGEPGFVSCPGCGGYFEATPDAKVAEEWLGPLSMILYPVMFESRPQQEANRIADELYAASEPGKQSIFRPLSQDQLWQVISATRAELVHPSQNVRDILDLRGNEKDLREYLDIVTDRLSMKLDGPGSVEVRGSRGCGDAGNGEDRSGWSLPPFWIFFALGALAVVIWGLIALR